MRKKILTACMGQCVHVAGAYNFMSIATNLGYECRFTGPATKVSTIITEIKNFKPNILGLSYRLTASTIAPILEEFKRDFEELKDYEKPKKILFAGIPEVVEIAKKYDFFDRLFVGGEQNDEIITALRNQSETIQEDLRIPSDLLSRISWKKPYPIIRAHFGLPDIQETVDGIKALAESKVLDVVSIAPDQNTQAHFFHPEDQQLYLSGAGGVPLRSEEDLLKLNKARLRGNFPLLRIYAGTRDFIRLAKLYKKTIQNAWAAIPIFWFNQMDGRGPLSLKESIQQHLEAIKWHAENDIPVEINDPHHWSLRDAPDAIAVADMYLCGIIAKKLGVKNFIAQYMFNTPPASSFNMDLAKILAKDELLNALKDDSFNIIKQVRTGLASLPLNLDAAKGHLAAATMIQLSIKPAIVHVVTHSEASHAAQPKDIIESCNIVRKVIEDAYSSNINFINEDIIKRKEELIRQAKDIIDIFPKLVKNKEEMTNPWINHNVLNRIVKYGIFDAPHLKNNKFARGRLATKIIDGACYSWDYNNNVRIDEVERVKEIHDNVKKTFIQYKKMEKKKPKEVVL